MVPARLPTEHLLATQFEVFCLFYSKLANAANANRPLWCFVYIPSAGKWKKKKQKNASLPVCVQKGKDPLERGDNSEPAIGSRKSKNRDFKS